MDFKTIILALDFSHIWQVGLIAWFYEQDQKSFSGKSGKASQPDIRQTSQPDQSCTGKSGDQANEGKGHQVYPLFIQKWCISFLERFFSKYFFTSIFLFCANFQNSFQIYRFPIFFIDIKKEDDLSSTSYLWRLYINQPCEPKPNEDGLCD